MTPLPPPPVLTVPDVIRADLRTELFDEFENGDVIESPMPTSDGQLLVDPDAKLRRDLLLTGSLLNATAQALHERLRGSVLTAFSFAPTRFEQIKMVCYPPGGHFHAHRDNADAETAHRRFAVTINLNDGYEGGGLRFGGFDPTPVVPGAGAAVVFGCGLEHEVVPVTEGERFALITFLS